MERRHFCPRRWIGLMHQQHHQFKFESPTPPFTCWFDFWTFSDSKSSTSPKPMKECLWDYRHKVIRRHVLMTIIFFIYVFSFENTKYALYYLNLRVLILRAHWCIHGSFPDVKWWSIHALLYPKSNTYKNWLFRVVDGYIWKYSRNWVV